MWLNSKSSFFFMGMVDTNMNELTHSYPIHLPWYGLLMALCVCGIFFVPIGIVMAITNQQSSLFLICQLICGTVFPGRPVANMVFVTYGYVSLFFVPSRLQFF